MVGSDSCCAKIKSKVLRIFDFCMVLPDEKQEVTVRIRIKTVVQSSNKYFKQSTPACTKHEYLNTYSD